MRSWIVWIVLVLAAAAPEIAAAATWIRVTGDNRSDSYLDIESPHTEGAIVVATLRWVPKKPSEDPELHKKVYYELDTHAFNCADSSAAFFAGRVAYGEAGEIVGSRVQPLDRLHFKKLTPGSIVDLVATKVCKIASERAGLKQRVMQGSIFGSTWKTYAKADDGQEFSSYRPDSFCWISADVVAVITRIDVPHGYQETADIPMTYHAVRLTGVNCKDFTFAYTVMDSYGADGQLIRSRELSLDEKKPRPIKPTSGLANLAKTACATPASQRADRSGAPTQGQASGEGAAGPQSPEPGLGSGTGWLTTKGYIVTAAHVVAHARSITVVQDREPVGEAEVVETDPANDVAVLKPKLKGGPRVAIPLEPAAAVLGEPVFTLGYPKPDMMGLSLKLTTGTINATSGSDFDHDKLDDTRLLQFSAPVQAGNSGGPVIDGRGRVVGIVVTRIEKFTEDQTAENVNYALKARYVRALLAELPDIGGYRPAVAQGDLPTLAKELKDSVFMLVVELDEDAETPPRR